MCPSEQLVPQRLPHFPPPPVRRPQRDGDTAVGQPAYGDLPPLPRWSAAITRGSPRVETSRYLIGGAAVPVAETHGAPRTASTRRCSPAPATHTTRAPVIAGAGHSVSVSRKTAASSASVWVSLGWRVLVVRQVGQDRAGSVGDRSHSGPGLEQAGLRSETCPAEGDYPAVPGQRPVVGCRGGQRCAICRHIRVFAVSGGVVMASTPSP